METCSALLALCEGNHWAPVDFHEGLVTWNVDIYFGELPNKRLNKQYSCWGFEASWRSCDVIVMGNETNTKQPILSLVSNNG